MQQSPQKKSFGLAISTSMIVGVMIGSGVFLLPASLAEFGSWSFYGMAVAALGAMALAWVFSSLGRWHPGLGGPYYYTRMGMGDFAAFLVAWGYWLSIWVGNAAISLAAASYLSLLAPSLFVASWSKPILALLLVWLFSYINIRGVREAGLVQLVTTLLKTIPLILFGLLGIWSIDTELLMRPPAVEMELGSVVLATTALWLWAFLGVESASIPADNIDQPEKNIPRATMLGVTLVALVYLLSAVVIFGTLDGEQLANSSGPYADAAGQLWGGWAAYFMITVAVVSSLGAMNGLILLGGQMPRAAAIDGVFPKVFGELNRHDAPARGIMISAVLTSILVLTNLSETTLGLYNFSILLSTTTLLVPYIFCSASVFRLVPDEQAKSKLSMLIFAVAFIFSIWAMGGSGRDAVYWGFILMMLSAPIYIIIKKQAENQN